MAMFIGVVCRVLLAASRRGGDCIMSMIALLVNVVFGYGQVSGNLNAQQQFIHSQIPLRISDVLKSFNLDGKTTTYAMCPSCHKGYAPSFSPGSSRPAYPKCCSNVVLERGICGQALLDNGKNPRPIKPFVYHHIDDFIGSLLARKDLEEHIDTACDELKASLDNGEETHFVQDVFQATFMRQFEGPDKKPFVDRGNEGRLAFALCVDYFNIEGLRKRGSTASTGMISMACLNLPYSIRYKPENMYLVGIIPGPHEPTETAINHYLEPMVHDMEVLWGRGVRYSRTALYPDGRTVRAAIVIQVCDLPGSRQVAGLAAHSHHLHFCSVCNFKHTGDLTKVAGQHDYHSWMRKDVEALRHHAERWRDATTVKQRTEIFEEHGVRYSVLWSLPYWDPTRQLIVDPMHTVLEGVVENHVRHVLKLSDSHAKAKAMPPPAFRHIFREPLPEGHPDYASLPPDKRCDDKVKNQIKRIHRHLTASLIEHNDPKQAFDLETLSRSLMCCRKKSLQFVYEDLGLPRPPGSGQKDETKAFYCQGFKRWVSFDIIVNHLSLMTYQREGKPRGAVPPPKIVTPAVISRVQEVIKNTHAPSWLGSVPRNFGETSAGTIKAAEWRVLITVHLPLAFISLWGDGTSHDRPEDALAMRKILDHTMSLVSAVILVCYRSMTARRAEDYLKYITQYVRDLKTLYTVWDVNYKPKHHMAFHLFDFLVLFGPVRSWWMFPFERLIGHLQRLPHNHMHGKLLSNYAPTLS